MSSDPNESLAPPVNTPTAQPPSAEAPSEASTSNPAPANPGASPAGDAAQETAERQRIKIGTQRPGAAVPRVESRHVLVTPGAENRPVPAPVPARQTPSQSATAQAPAPPASAPADAETSAPEAAPPGIAAPGVAADSYFPQPELRPKPQSLSPSKNAKRPNVLAPTPPKVQPPNIRAALSPELAAEMEDAFSDFSFDELIDENKKDAVPAAENLEPESRHKARVVSVHRDNVFVDVGTIGRNQGVVPLKQFAAAPEVGTEIEVVVVRFNNDEGLYDLTVPHAAASVGDWSEVSEGMVVDARITGHNKGGLECEVSALRGFIPAGQVSLYRVEDLSQFVGQKLTCVVTEANPERRNLVLSHKAVLERAQAEAKTKLLAELQVGDVREGVVRSIREFGAFVDIGGVDGLIHVSQMSWDRVKHPSEVLEVGQKVQVKIQKIDPETGKISLAYRELSENPWATAAMRYPVTSIVTGTISKIMEFGAFVKLEPGIEGLIHVSELSHQRVHRVSAIVKEGQQVECKVVSFDADQQRIGLSMKALMQRPEPKNKVVEPEIPEEPDVPLPPRKEPKVPLKGGRPVRESESGARFGLKW